MPRKCDCAGPCGPQFPQYDVPAEDALSRRDFIALAGATGASALIPFESLAAGRRESAARAYEEWQAGLHKPAPPRTYRSETHTDARMPLGGIGTGNFDLRADGQLTTWQLFNTLRDGQVPLFFGVKCGQTARMLQTRGGPDGIPRIKAIEMTGDYPIATLKFQDTDLPVRLEMTAFSPFEPLNTRLSSMPLACFVYKIHNPTKKAQTVSLAAFMQNPVGYDALGVPISFNSVGFNSVGERLTPHHPNFGGNVNSIGQTEESATVLMSAQTAPPISLPVPVRVYTNVPPAIFRTPYEGLPATLSIDGLDKIDPTRKAAPAGSASRSDTVIWLEDAPVDLPVTALRRAVEAARGGAVLAFAGREQPLLKLYGDVTGGKPFDRAAFRPDILFEDFENGYANWKLEGSAFGTGPAGGTLDGQQRVAGFQGKGLVNSFLGGDVPTGKMTSRAFTIERNFIRFLVGGGRHADTQVRLVVDGKVVRAQSGKDNEQLEPVLWDVREFKGRQAHIEIVDENTGAWGHVNVDQIVFADLPGNPETLELLASILPASFSGLRPGPGTTVELVDPHALPSAREGALPNSLRFLTGSGPDGPAINLVFGGLLPADQRELVGARRRALRDVLALALHPGQFSAPVGIPDRAPGHGSLALTALSGGANGQASVPDWEFAWRGFTGGRVAIDGGGSPPSGPGQTVTGYVTASVDVPPGKTVEVPFLLAWHYPNHYSRDGEPIGNHYTTLWPSAQAVIEEAGRSFAAIRAKTERFRHVFYDSTLPHWMLDAVTSQISTLRHRGILFRLANGDVYGWEGSNGCCDPTCTHVWGYEQTLARLFPDLERDMRRIDYKHQQRADGGINNRTQFPSPPHPTGEQPFTDGHASCILKAYREGLNHPDESWLKEYWPGIRKAVEYLINRDAATSGGTPNGLLEDDQWNTYDEALHGVTTFIGSYYLAALRAGEELAHRFGDHEFGNRCRQIFSDGQRNLIEKCWDGEYFNQNLPDYKSRWGEVGPGCMSDQLIGQWWAHQLGLGYLLPPDMVKKALASVFKYNFKPDLTGWKHIPRAFAGSGDKGLIICTWPKGGRPDGVMLYSDEVWTGIEYQVAAHMAYEGMLDESFSIVKGLRERYDGRPRAPIPRNPWNEIECGGHYARAMSSWSMLLALSGCEYDGPAGRLRFTPRHTPENHKSFFTGPEGWGTLKQARQGGGQTNEVAVAEGSLKVARIHLDSKARTARVTLAGKPVRSVVKPSISGIEIAIEPAVSIRAGQSLAITLS